MQIFRATLPSIPCIAVRIHAVIILPKAGSVNNLSVCVWLKYNVDARPGLLYNTLMMKTKRTARKDSNFVIYVASHNGLHYIGLTRKGSTTVVKAVKERWRKHISRAKHEDRVWELYKYIKSGNWDGWTHQVLDVIRGRAEAYAYERELVKHIEPELNDQYL